MMETIWTENRRTEVRVTCASIRQEIEDAQTEEKKEALRQILEKIEKNNAYLLRKGETF